MMVNFLFISLPAKTPCPTVLSVSPGSAFTWNVLLLRLLTGLDTCCNQPPYLMSRAWIRGQHVYTGRKAGEWDQKWWCPLTPSHPKRKLKLLFSQVLPIIQSCGNSYKWSLWLHLILMRKLIYQSFGTLRERRIKRLPYFVISIYSY